MPVDSAATSCRLWLPKKQRYCQMDPLPGKEYCSIHLREGDNIAPRVNCPIDPSHSVYKKSLSKHLKRCPALKEKDKRSQPYFKHNINSGSNEAFASLNNNNNNINKNPSCKANSTKTTENINVNSSEEHGETTKEAVSALKHKLSRMNSEQVSDIVNKINEAYDKYAKYYEPQPLKYEHDSKESIAGKAKHRLQNSAIVRHLEDSGFLTTNVSRVFIEFGAGKANLSLELQKSIGGRGKFVLVDRSKFRRKADHHIKTCAEEAIGADNASNCVLRLNVDIADLDLKHVPYESCPMNNETGKWPTVCIGKHLCGSATDLTLRCITRAISSADVNNKDDSYTSFYFDGIAIALCCHQRCDFISYINKEFFINIGFTPEEFEFISLLSSWAVAATGAKAYGGVSDDVMEPPSELEDLDPTRRARLGMKCKGLIDAGRLEYLKKFGFTGKLVYFIDSWISPENVMLLVTRE